MALNSVNTNQGAQIALQSLQSTNAQLAVTEKQVSTGYRVADAVDDGAAYAIATNVRSTTGALTSANQQLGYASGLLSTTMTSLNSVTSTMGSMRDVLVKLADASVTGNERSQYSTQYTSMANQVKSFIQDAGYGGKSLIGDITGSNGGGSIARVAVPRNETGTSYGVTTFSGSALYGSINIVPAGATISVTTAEAAITTTGSFLNNQNAVGTALNTIGSETNFVNSQVSYNNNKIDSLNAGIGSLVDADLAKESAQLTALQIKQQLGTQALSLSNQAPQSLLSLFK